MISWAGLSAIEADMELGAGNPDHAYRALAEGAEVLAASSETGYLATVLSMQSLAALELGRPDEALSLTAKAVEIAVPDDIDPHARDRLVRGRVAAQRGDYASAAELIQEAGSNDRADRFRGRPPRRRACACGGRAARRPG